MSVNAKLTMRCVITAVTGQDISAEPTYANTPTTGVQCFVFGNKRRVLTSQNREVVPDYHFLFLPSADININYKITSVLDRFGNVVISDELIVNQVTDNHHPKRGLVLREAYVSRI